MTRSVRHRSSSKPLPLQQQHAVSFVSSSSVLPIGQPLEVKTLSSSSSSPKSSTPRSSPVHAAAARRRLTTRRLLAKASSRYSIVVIFFTVSLFFTFVFYINSIYIIQYYHDSYEHDKSSLWLRRKVYASSRSQHNHHNNTKTPRVVFLQGKEPFFPEHHRKRKIKDPMREIDPNHMELPDTPQENPDCVPMAPWQTASYPTCNEIHAIDLSTPTETNYSVLAEGWFRTTYEYTPVLNRKVVLKMLRPVREFLPEYYELHRRDAVAMERLTHSPHVVDIYSFCGNSAINEFADFPFMGISSLEQFDRRVRGKTHERALAIKLKLAVDIATGLSHIHQGGDRTSQRVQMVHYDINPRNVAMFDGAKPKLNDFNIAEFLKINHKTNKTCGFPNRMHQPWWRAPEEVQTETVLLDEKVDVYSLGSVLFHILTTHSPWGKMKDWRYDEVTSLVRNGTKPKLMAPFDTANDTATRTFRTAFERCFPFHPRERASAKEIADLLQTGFDTYVSELKEAGIEVGTLGKPASKVT